MPVHDVDALGAVVAEQGRPLVRALSPPDDHDSRARQCVEGDQVAGVRPLGSRNTVVPGGEVDEVPDAWCCQNPVSRERGPVLHRRHERPVAVGQRPDLPPIHVELLAVGEPVRVVEEHRDRDRVEVARVQATILEVRGEGVLARRVEVPVRARSQVHVGRHLVPPERHRDADDVSVQPSLPGVGSSRVGVRPRPDHEELGMLRHRRRLLLSRRPAARYRVDP